MVASDGVTTERNAPGSRHYQRLKRPPRLPDVHTWLDRTLTVNASAFYIDWKDQQVIYYPPPQQTYNYYTINAGTSRVYGMELETRYQPTSEFDFYASTDYSNTRFINFVVGEKDFTGNRFANAPRWTLATGATWSSPRGRRSGHRPRVRSGGALISTLTLQPKERGSSTLMEEARLDARSRRSRRLRDAK